MLNGPKLSSIAKASDTANVITKSLASRERLRHVTDISRVRNELVNAGERIVDEEYMAYWKALQDEKVGTIIFGRRGKPNRFAWHYSLKSIAKAATTGESIEAKQISNPVKVNQPEMPTTVIRKRGRPFGSKVKNKQSAMPAPAPMPQLASPEKIVYIQRADNTLVEFKIPANTSAQELEMLINVLKGMGNK